MELLLSSEISILLRQKPFSQHSTLDSRPSSPFSPKRLDSLGSFLYERSCGIFLFSYTLSALYINIRGDDIGFEEKNRMSYVLSRGSSPRYQRGTNRCKNITTRSPRCEHEESCFSSFSTCFRLTALQGSLVLDMNARWLATQLNFLNL